MAERKGFEPLLEDYSKHDFQSCALDQLSHLSVQVVLSPSRRTHTRHLSILTHIAVFLKSFSEKCGEEVERSRKETHSGVGSAVLPLRVRTRVRFFCAGAR